MALLAEGLIKLKSVADLTGWQQQLNALHAYQSAANRYNQQNQRNAANNNSPFGNVKEQYRDLIRFVRGVRTISFAFRDAGRQFTMFGAALVTTLSAVAVEGAKFEQGMANIRSVVSELSDGSAYAELKFQELSNTLAEVAATTIFTASEITDAAEQLALAGFNTREIQDSIFGIANLAAAAGESAESTANSLVTILRGFGIAASETERVADTLTAVFTNTNTTLTTLKESLKIATPVAAAFGVTLEETAAAIGLLGNAGVTGSLAGTGLTRLLTQLVTDVDDLNEILLQVGSSAEAVDPMRVGIQGVVEEFRRLLVAGKITQAQLAATFDQRALRALLNLVNQGSDAFDRLNVKINESAGLTAKVASIRLDTVQGQFERVTSEISRLSTEIFATFAPALKLILTEIAKVISAISKWVTENKEFVKALTVSAAYLGVFLISLGALSTAVGIAAAAFATLSLAVGGFRLALEAAFVVVGNITRAVGLLAGTIAAGVVAFSAFIAIIGAVAVALTIIGIGLQAIGLDVKGAITKVLEFFNVIDTAEEKAAKLAKITEEFEKLTAIVNDLAPKVAALLRDVQQYADTIGKGGFASLAELRRASGIADKLGVKNVDDLKAKIRELTVEYNKASAQAEELKKAAEESGDFSAYNEGVARVEALRKSILSLQQVASNLSSLAYFSDPSLSFEQVSKIVQDNIDSVENALTAAKARLDTAISEEDKTKIGEEVAQYEIQLERMKFVMGVLNSLGEEFYKDFADAMVKTNGDFDKSLEMIIAEKEKIAAKLDFDRKRDKRISDAAIKASQELKSKLESALATSSLPPIASKMEELIELEREIRELMGVIARNATLDEADELIDAFEQAMQGIDRQKQEFLDARDKNRNEQILELELERAKLEKDVTKAMALLRKKRNEELNDIMDADFDKSGITDQKELKRIEDDRLKFRQEYNKETDRLLVSLEEELTKVEDTKTAAEEIALEQSERNKLEEEIAKKLSSQVDSLKDAVAVSQFLRAESRRRARDAADAAEAEEKAEARLLRLTEERAAIAARGGDTSMIDAKIRRLAVKVETAQQVSDLRAGEAGFRTRTRDFQDELKAAAEAGRKRGRAEAPNAVESLFPIVNLFAQFARRASGIQMQQPGGGVNIPAFKMPGAPNINIPAMPQSNGPTTNNYTDNRKITIEIKTDVDPKAIRKAVREAIALENLGMRGN